MKKVLAAALTAIVAALGTAATSGCMIVFLDEPTMPESLR